MSTPKGTNAGRKVGRKVLVAVAVLVTVIPIVYFAWPLANRAEKVETAPMSRPVRSIIVEKHEIKDPVVVTGHLRAREEVSLGFRLSGKLIERKLDVGDTVKAGQIVARLDDEIERNARNAAQAELAAAQAALEQSESFERRQHQLLKDLVLSQNNYDLAVRQLKTARAQVDAAKANLRSAEEQLGYTDLKSEATGVVTQKGAEPGEVVQAGQMILKVARQEGRDAVFNMPAQLIREGLVLGQEVEIWLADNQDIATVGKVREISPQADLVTRNYQVKVELGDPPSGMFLGATVVGRLNLQAESLIEIPSSALTMLHDKSAVWVIDPLDQRVRLREINIARYAQDSVVIADGLEPGECVVTAGVQELHEGQEVKRLGDPS